MHSQAPKECADTMNSAIPMEGEPAKRVLFADDDPLFREGFAERLRREGFDVVCTCEADGVVKLLQELTFDALISDIIMPGNTNLELIEKLPQIIQGLPVILMTGNPTLQTAIKSVHLSVAGYLTKPPDFAQLIPLLNDSIAQYRRRQCMQSNRALLQQWSTDLEQLENALKHRGSPESATPLHHYLALSLRHMVQVMLEMEKATQVLARMDSGPNAVEKLDLINALRKTVDVLEKTKQSFRSKDLGDLRKQIDDLLKFS